MDTKKLRQKILDLAIHGKLVPQDPNDEPASVLLERIRAEKERLIKDGKIKRGKKSAKTSDTPHYEQVPFEVPEGWTWVTLGEIGIWQSGATPSRMRKDYYGGSIPWLKTGDLNDGIIEEIPEAITEKALEETSVKLNPEGSVLIAMYGATIGKIGILSYPATTNQACCACIDYIVEQKYLFYFLLANRDNFIAMGGGGAQPNISKEKIIATQMPFPPIEEQKRIVKEIERWLEFVSMIESSKEKLDATIEQAKIKILDLAIHGKLVPQYPADEPAIDLLSRINPKFTPCDNGHNQNIPQGWVFCQIKDIVKLTMGQSPNGESVNTNTGIEFHQGKICFTEKYISKSDKYTTEPTKTVEPNSLLLCVRAPVGDVNITPRKICIGRGLCGIVPIEGDLAFFYYLFLSLKDSFDSKATGSTFKAISGDIIKEEQIILPPLTEQQRIVARIEELFATLDSIQAALA